MYYFYTMTRLLFISIFIFQHAFGQSIFDVARTGNEWEMRSLLDQHPEQINQLSEQGLSPFILAAYRGNNAVAKLLIERGADIKTCYPEGSAIYGVIYKNNIEVLDLLLKQGVSVNDTCQFNQFGTPLQFAMSLKRYEIIERIMKENPNMLLLDQHGKSIVELLTMYKDEKLNQIIQSHEK
jgi:ankyrin repeat protein